MTCGKRWYTFALVSLCLLLVARLAHGQAIEYTPPPLGQTQPDSSLNWTELDALLRELESEALNLSDESENLKALLERLKLESVRLSSALAESRTLAAGLSISLADSAQSLDRLGSQDRAMRLELWLWRGATVAGLILAGYFAFR